MRTGRFCRRAAAVVAVISALFLSSAAQAEVLFYSGGTARTDGGIVAGNTFTAFFGATFNSLGFIDVGSDGLAGSYQVGIWDSSQNLLASATVTPSSPLINGFRYAAIPATTIPSGQTFTIGALLPASPADAWIENPLLILGVGFTGAGTGRFVTSGTLAFPTTLDPENETYAVANASDVVVPEPAGLLPLLCAGIACVRRARRQRRRRSAYGHSGR
jgi:hypothetical protein